MPVSGKKNQMPVSRNNSRYTKNTSITRSRSSGVLNQSDSDPETQEKKVSRLMRPTISSHNKISNKTLQNRKKHSYSTSKFSIVNFIQIFQWLVWATIEERSSLRLLQWQVHIDIYYHSNIDLKSIIIIKIFQCDNFLNTL